jgi:hypothetical protein
MEKAMQRLILAVPMVVLFSAVAQAQTGDPVRGWGYGFGGVGAAADEGAIPLVHFGGGGEALLGKGFALGGELGYMAPMQDGANGAGLFAANTSYHFGGRDRFRKLVPFVTGGYALVFRSGIAANGGNFGGGFQYWASERVGLRVEFRDFIFSSDSPHTISIRFGVSFR